MILHEHIPGVAPRERVVELSENGVYVILPAFWANVAALDDDAVLITRVFLRNSILTSRVLHGEKSTRYGSRQSNHAQLLEWPKAWDRWGLTGLFLR
jgi:hypothetical protein